MPNAGRWPAGTRGLELEGDGITECRTQFGAEALKVFVQIQDARMADLLTAVVQQPRLLEPHCGGLVGRCDAEGAHWSVPFRPN